MDPSQTPHKPRVYARRNLSYRRKPRNPSYRLKPYSRPPSPSPKPCIDDPIAKKCLDENPEEPRGSKDHVPYAHGHPQEIPEPKPCIDDPVAQKYSNEELEQQRRMRAMFRQEYAYGRPQEITETQKAREFQVYLKKLFPYPLWAIEHYNKEHKEEEQYKVSKIVDRTYMYLPELGFFHRIYFEAQPKSLEQLDSSATKLFFARVHEMPGNPHVSDCSICPGPLESGTLIAESIALCCTECGINNVDEFISRSKELSQEAETQELRGEARRTYGNTYFCEPCNCGRWGSLGKSEGSSLTAGGEKFQAEAPSEDGSGSLSLPWKYGDMSWFKLFKQQHRGRN